MIHFKWLRHFEVSKKKFTFRFDELESTIWKRILFPLEFETVQGAD